MDNLKEEYERAKKNYHDLEVIVAQKIAGTIGASYNDCPDEVLKQHLQALKIYIIALEQRLKYE